MLDPTIADNPPKSPFFKGGPSQIPPFLKGDQGNSVALFESKLSNFSTGVLKETLP
jgi:hypothetical protein